jgi:hypothetical protein
MHFLRLFLTSWLVLGTVTMVLLFWLCKHSAGRVGATVKDPLPDISGVPEASVSVFYG